MGGSVSDPIIPKAGSVNWSWGCYRLGDSEAWLSIEHSTTLPTEPKARGRWFLEDGVWCVRWWKLRILTQSQLWKKNLMPLRTLASLPDLCSRANLFISFSFLFLLWTFLLLLRVQLFSPVSLLFHSPVFSLTFELETPSDVALACDHLSVSGGLVCYLHFTIRESHLFPNSLPSFSTLLAKVHEGSYLTECLSTSALAYKILNIWKTAEYLLNKMLAFCILSLSQGQAWVLLHPLIYLPLSNQHLSLTFLSTLFFASLMHLVS